MYLSLSEDNPRFVRINVIINGQETVAFAELTRDNEYVVLTKNSLPVNIKINSLIIPDEALISAIDHHAFYKHPELKEIKLPNTLKVIQMDAFRECSNIESLEIPGSVEKIEKCALNGCDGLKSLKFNTGTVSINGNCLGPSHDDSISFAVEFPDTIAEYVDSRLVEEKIGFADKIQINYKDFDSLKSTVEALFKFFASTSNTHKNTLKNNMPEIIFNGVELTVFQSHQLSTFLEQFDLNANFEVNFELTEALKKETQDLFNELGINRTFDEDIDKLLKNIGNTIKNLPFNNIIVDELNLITNDYNNDIKAKKPVFGGLTSDFKSEKPELTFSGDTLMNDKVKTLNILNRINTKIAGQNNLYQELIDLNEYRVILDNGVKNPIENAKTFKEELVNYKYISTYLKEDKTKKIETDLRTVLDEIIKRKEKELLNFLLSEEYDDSLKFESADNKKIETVFNSTINEESVDINGMIPFIKTLKDLKSKESDSSLTKKINEIKQLIADLNDNEHKQSIEDTVNKVISIYTNELESCLEANDLSSEIYNKIINGFDKSLEDTKILIMSRQPISNYEKEKANVGSLISQLDLAKNIVLANEILEMDDEQIKKLPIASYALDIHNRLIKKIGLNQDVIKIGQDMANAFEEDKKVLEENKDLDSLEEYNEKTKEIMSKIAAFEFSINDYIEQVVEYQKYGGQTNKIQ